MEEEGLLKLDESDVLRYKVSIPFVFIKMYMTVSANYSEYSEFWKELSPRQKFWWRDLGGI